jgi:ABC-type Zn uptake system ZnuABC Zn-binding protein ZnuA
MTRPARLLFIASLLIAGCGQSVTQQLPPPRVTVFATIYPLAEIAREIGGDSVRIDWLVEQGKLLNGFTMTQRERDRMTSTDLVLCDSYRRTETWAAPDLALRQNTGSVMTLDNMPTTTDANYPSEGLLELDPVVISQFVIPLSDTMVRLQPRRTDSFRAAAATFKQQVDALITQYPPAVFGGAKVVVLSNVWKPLLYRTRVTPVLVDCDVYRFTERDAAAVKKAASNGGATAIIVPFDLPIGAVKRIEQLTGVQTLALDNAGLAGFKGHDTYVAIAQYNLQQLATLNAK